ncbi:putative bifunctional diguanylate cyclase/phosphodiesterase [Thiocystis violacea]|uniref:putative bifunctional diguanylate cyclase/phosphodiesterase n=1 Tax=Thiocystis violacea TaxID=13725 RepID=UPI001906CA02|nr:EAL domain-containing protein [Thiocystis violacea]MBK1717151.1 hypothetical protein [Thiocystis violacea]
MPPSWHSSILFRTGLVLVAVFVLLGALTVALNLKYDRIQAEAASKLRLSQLLDTVESTASVACFAGDEVLAAELASGLLRNSEVLSVVIQAGELELASRRRSQDPVEASADANATPLVREVFSPFTPETRVGRILLTPNLSVIREAMHQEAHVAMVQMALQLLLVALAVAAAMLLRIIRPIKAISDGLHGMDATRGERLPLPAGHRRSEIGRLVTDVNLMADRLVKALDEERGLRIQREIDERRYHAIFKNAETGIFIIDNEGILTSWNPAFARLARLPVVDEPPTELSIFCLGWKEPARLAEVLLGCLSNHRSTAADLPFRTPEGPDRWLSMVLTPIAEQSIQGVIHDVTQHKEAERSARQMAVTDSLTGVANPLGLEQRMQELTLACDLRQHEGFALILISFDDFRRILDGFGPATGDEILKEATRRLSRSVKSTDVVARIGADQFALVLVDLQRDLDAERVAARILQGLHQHYFVAGSPLRLHVSAGIAFYPQDTDAGIPGLMQHAGLALSHAKASNGSDVRFFDPNLAKIAEHRRRLEYDLRRAVREKQFVLFFQPIVDLKHNRLAGAEALIRWQHPERGLVPPDEFIPLAEETGLITDMGLWVVEEAGRQLAAWRREGKTLSLSVNVSACQIPDGLPPDILLDLASRLDFTPASLALEITEGVLLSDLGGAQTWLEAVRANGFPVYLDDFGTGYSSLSYLKRFSVDRLKVDKSFVRDINTNVGDQALVEAVTAMARSFEIEVVAEGVEDAGHVRLLRRMGCRYAQGYYFSRPVPIESFPDVGERIPELLLTTLES